MSWQEQLDVIFRKVIGIPADVSIDGLDQDNTARWDSLRNAELLMAVQDQFGFRFKIEEIRKLQSVVVLRAIVEQRKTKS